MLLKGSRALIAAAAASLMAACGGNRHTTADSFWGDNPDEAGKVRPLRQTEELGDSAAPQPITPSESMTAWVGVRHDLMLAPAPKRQERCSCLAVEVGDPKDPRFQWAAGAPEIGSDAMAIALTARGVPCPGGNPDEEQRRPSISAVDQEGNDIIVEVEELRDGRPLASGAVIPRPAQGGSIYVKGQSSALPYARPAGGARCKVF
jgi:hypothetical protein